VFLAITGFQKNILFSQSVSLPASGTGTLRMGGLIVTLLLWIHQERTIAYWNHFVCRAAELEEKPVFLPVSNPFHSGFLLLLQGHAFILHLPFRVLDLHLLLDSMKGRPPVILRGFHASRG
jgi:nitrate reductase gamma subunit